MLMRWDDLEEGDVVELNPAFSNNIFTSIFSKLNNKKLTIDCVVPGSYKENITISFKEIIGYRISIDRVGGFYYEDYNGAPLLKIIGLKND